MSSPDAPADEPSTTAPGPSRPAGGPATPFLIPVIPGRYVLEGVLGRGGQAVVYRARDMSLDREVAIKELIPPASQDPDSREASTSAARVRFLREARITGLLEHPNVVPVHEVGRKEDGTLYCVQKLVRGRTLRDAIASCRSRPERLGLLASFEGACHALAYAHSRGIVHRDIKPANIMVGEFGETVVLDWGLAKVIGAEDAGAATSASLSPMQAPDDATMDGDVLGTPAFMSPEQARGEPADARSDVWSLGAVLHAILTGHAPNHDGAEGPAGAPASDRLRSMEAMPRDLAAIVERALATNPSERHATAADLAADVQAFRDGRAVGSYDYSAWESIRRIASTHRVASAAAALSLVVLVGALVVVSAAWHEARTNLGLAFLEKAHRAERDHDWSVAEVSHARAYALGGSDEARWGLALTADRGPMPEARYMLPSGTPVLSLATSPLGDIGASVHEDGSVHAWSMASGEAIASRSQLPSPPHAVTFDETGRLLAVTAAGDLVTWTPDEAWRQSSLPVGNIPRHAALRAARGRLVVQHADGVACISLPDGQMQWSEPAAGGIVAISGDGEWIARISSSGEVDVSQPSTRVVHRFQANHARELYGASLSRSGSLLALLSGDRTVSVWDVDARVELARLKGHDGVPSSAAFSSDEAVVATAGGDRSCIFWETRSGRIVARISEAAGSLSHLAIGPGDASLLAHVSDGSVRTWTLPLSDRVLTRGPAVQLRGLAFSPGSDVIAWVGDDGWLARAHVSDRGAASSCQAHPGRVQAALFSPDGRLVVTAGAAGTIATWDAATLRPLARIVGDGGRIGDAAFGPDGRVWTVASDGSLRAWDPIRGIELRRIDQGEGLSSVAVSPDGGLVVAAQRDRSIRAWDAAAGTEAWSVRLDGRGVILCIAISTDGHLVAVGMDSSELVLLDLRTGTERGRLDGHDHWIADVAFQPGGPLLASAGFDTLRLWDVASLRQVAVTDRAGLPAASVAWSHDGTLLAQGGIDGLVRVLRLVEPGARNGVVERAMERRQVRQVGTNVFDIDARPR